MTETVGREIELDGVDPRELYGAQDVWLEQIRELHPALKIIARGSTLRVLGPREQTERFARRMEGLAAYYLKYGHISSEVVAQSFAGEVSVCVEPTEGDVLLIGNGGAAITGYRIYAAAATWSAKDNAYVRSGEWEYKAEVGVNSLSNVTVPNLENGADYMIMVRAMKEACEERGIKLYCPSPVYCTDNAAMIGAAAYYEYLAGTRHGWDLNAVPNLKLGERYE